MIGDGLRHKHFQNQLNAMHDVSAVFIESSHYPLPVSQTEEESEAWDWFFIRRSKFEKNVVGPKRQLKAKNNPDIHYLKKNDINSSKTISMIKKYSPGFIAAFGTSIMKENFLSRYSECTYNLHLGNPEFYRGSSCNFWPIYNRDLQQLGATVHKIEKKVDAGKIVAKSFITMDIEDDEQSLMWKTLQAGTQIMGQTIQKWKNSTLDLKAQDKIGRLYTMNDFTPAAILIVKKMVESGELKNQIESSLREQEYISKD